MENCNVCGNSGRIWDEMSAIQGGPLRKYCFCVHGDRMCAADAEKARLHLLQFSPCPTCNGTGEVENEE